MAEHWEVDASGFNIKEEGKPITVAMTQPHSRMKQRARLIAAAPDLLEALQGLGAMPEGYCFCFGGNRKRNAARPDHQHTGKCRAARAAIAKATGGAS